MRFILFCNLGYGRAYEDAFRQWCAQRKVDDWLVVHSLRRSPPSRRALSRLVERLSRDRLVETVDVNGEAFSRRCLIEVRPLHGVVAGFDQIFTPAAITRFTTLHNFHPSLLPFYRGPVPSYWCIQNGERATGITLHVVGKKIDSGEIIWQKSIPIATRDPEELDRSLAALGAALLPEVLDCLREGRPLPSAMVAADQVYERRVNYMSYPPS